MDEEDWVEYAEDRLLGKYIMMVRYLTEEEARQFGWSERPLCVQLGDGSIFFASSDPEANAAGCMVGQASSVNLPEGEHPEDWTFPAMRGT